MRHAKRSMKNFKDKHAAKWMEDLAKKTHSVQAVRNEMKRRKLKVARHAWYIGRLVAHGLLPAKAIKMKAVRYGKVTILRPLKAA